MRLRFAGAALFFISITHCSMQTNSTAPPRAVAEKETILAGGTVVAGSAQRPQANWSVVVANGLVVAIGPAGTIRQAHPEARVVDVSGTTLLPGLTDAHGHLYGLGQSLDTVSLFGTHSYDEVIARVRERAASASANEWILGRGWDQNHWSGKAFPTSAPLDAAIPDHPVWLRPALA